MSRDPVAGAAGNSLVQRITEGVGILRERTIEIGARVIWIDNIGSIVILRGRANYALAILGGLLALVGLTQLQDQNNAGVALVLIVAGIALIAFNLSQPVNNGLSIGTTDGRSTLIVSDNERFLTDTLDLLREKIDTGSITLQGTFDIGATHVNTGGGGVVVGDRGQALAKAERADFGAGFSVTTPDAHAPASTPIDRQGSSTAPSPPQLSTAFEPPRSYAVEEPYPSEAGAEPASTRRSLPIALLATLVLAVTGGGFAWWSQAETERRDWEAVSRTDPGALGAYLSAHPSGRYRSEAQAALTQIEEALYDMARQSGDAAMLENFLTQFPQSSHAAAVRSQMEQIEQDQARVQAFMASAPELIAPPQGTIFDIFPRQMVLQWAPLQGASSYIVEVEMFDPSLGLWVEDPGRVLTVNVVDLAYSFAFVGAQPGRWRVRGIDSEGRQSAASEWWVFYHKR